MSDELNYLILTFFFITAEMYKIKRNRMKRWRQERLQNRAVQIGKSRFQMSNLMKVYIYRSSASSAS